MVWTDTELPDDPLALRQLLVRQQEQLETLSRQLHAQEHSIVRKDARIVALEHKLEALKLRHFGKSSEKNPDQYEFFNEAELVAQSDPDEECEDFITVPAHRRQARKSRRLPPDLPRVEVIHDLAEADKQCSCGQRLRHIGEDTLEQLCVIPQQFFVIEHKRLKYACQCKACICTASMPAQPLPGSQASPQLLAQVMVAKYHDGLPLYRQEKIARRERVQLPRAKLARWLIGCAELFQPVFNLLQDTFFSYDIALTDETGIQVLKEHGRAPQTKSYLWIRRGGPPDKPVVLVDYEKSASGQAAQSLLSEFHGYLVCDGAPIYNQPVKANGLTVVYCNDHARRRFREALVSLGKSAAAKQSIAAQGIKRYRTLYRLEKNLKHLSVEGRYLERQRVAVPLWDAFIDWAKEKHGQGVAHEPTREALAYLLKHAQGLRRYCEDARLPISNIQSEHVAKTIALARKNFLFADTEAGAASSAMLYSILESAQANHHHTQRYLSVVLTELPNARDLADIEALLPWNLTPDEVARRFATCPTL